MKINIKSIHFKSDKKLEDFIKEKILIHKKSFREER